MTKIDFRNRLKVSKISKVWLKLEIDLLPDTKLTKDIIQLVFVAHFAADPARVVQATPDIQRRQR